MLAPDAVVPPDVPVRLAELAARWRDNSATEKAAFQTYALELCTALGVQPPSPPTDAYCFERSVKLMDRDGRESSGWIDLYKQGHFALEGKASGEERSRDELLRRAYGQVRQYAANVSAAPPPFLMVLDVGRVLMVWDAFSGAYGGFGAGHRIHLPTLHERPADIALLRDIWERPQARDPRGKAKAVTQDLAGRLARLAAQLEACGHEQERVARFLMRVVFCCFAEDIALLPNQVFRRTLEAAARTPDPTHLQQALGSLWRTMDTGGLFGAEILQRFNGHFFQTVEALPLEPADAALLLEASQADWSGVEPTIFGTLLVRALDPEERHRLGAEYTPRAYIERLIEPTVLEPIRERWTAVQAEVIQLEQGAAGKARPRKADAKSDPLRPARERLNAFHEWLCGLKFLDPACGSGNFLYVTMAAVKRIELEVFREMERLGDQRDLMAREVHPRQFHGIEVKWWAREIAELTLWIGYHQFWRETHGGRLPPDPILEDTGTIECRDAVLAFDDRVHRPDRDRLDPTPRIAHPVTGEIMPDPEAVLKYFEYVNPRAATWPRADFIIGNPPYIGLSRQRDALGDGYVDALRRAYGQLEDSIDFVMYWWWKAGEQVASGATMRAGLITTNSITQIQNRRVISRVRTLGSQVVWAIANHPWVEEVAGASVRVAMTVQSREANSVRLAILAPSSGTLVTSMVTQINDDLTSGADVASCSNVALLSNAGIAHDGVKLHGKGFILNALEAKRLANESDVVKPYLNGRDIAKTSRGSFVVDFGLMTEDQARKYPKAYTLVAERVKPQRDANKRESYRRFWWRYGEPRPELREAITGLRELFGTVDTSRTRYFVSLPPHTIVDDKVVVIAADDRALFAVLSSAIHCAWADAAGGRLGVGDDSVYTKSRCFDAYPFPVVSREQHAKLAAVAEHALRARDRALESTDQLTLSKLHGIVSSRLRNEALTVEDGSLYIAAGLASLQSILASLDAAVAAAYGWPWPMERDEILERLVALHDERVAEERRGLVRWLRPEYQIPRFGQGLVSQVDADLDETPRVDIAAAAATPWPDTVIGQLTAINTLLARGPVSTESVTAAFAGAKAELVARHLETLAMMGEAVRRTDGSYALAKRAA